MGDEVHGRQPAGRPGDHWWTRQRSRRVRHEKKVHDNICCLQIPDTPLLLLLS